ncbi:hypothetical protein AA0X71_23440 [Robertmurraya sp. 2P01SA]|uniref:hypothetical protein n=1 Tax=Robertmurraya sp. 2P01SA TaxID=3132300 RepID=UPI0039A55376
MQILEFYKENNQQVNIERFYKILGTIGANTQKEKYIVNEKEILKLSEELKTIKAGIEMADTYHDLIYRALKQIFDGNLSRGLKEVKIDNGIKRVDIVFDNFAKNGFFAYVSDSCKVYCPKILVECKNYNSDPKNPEIDQLIGRLGKHTGKLGILVCRTVEDKKRLLERCQKALRKEQGHIIFLTDDDIRQLLVFKANNDDDGILQLLMVKWDCLVLEQELK